MFKKISLRTKAIIFAIALGTVPVLGLGAINYSLASKDIRNDAIKNQQTLATTIGDKISRFMFERYLDIQTMSDLPMFTAPKLGGLTNRQQQQDILDRLVKTYKLYDSIILIDLNGNVIAQSKAKVATQYRDVDYFKAVRQTGQPVISRPRASTTTGTFSLFTAAPVKDAITGKTIAVIRARMPVDKLAQIMETAEAQLEESIKSFGQYEYHLVDSSGKFFLAEEKNHVGRDAASDFSVFAQMQTASKVETAVDVDQIDKAEQLVTYAPLEKLEGLPELNWSIILAKDTKDVFATEKQLLLSLMLGTGVTALLGSGFAVLLANRTSNLIKGIASAIASSSTEIAATLEEQERTVSQQASSVNQTTTTMDELDASSRQSAQQAEVSAAGAQQALTLAEGGTKSVQQTMEGMETLKEKVGAIAEQILCLSEQTNQIGSISDLVGDLANQTNMLALNAAVEAARAGEHGKGFSVVAGEIRKLADQSKKSAEKINALVGDIQAAINTTVTVTDEGTKTVDEGIQLTKGTAETFTGVADSINNVFLNNQQISLSAKQQAIAVGQVVAAMNAINLGAKESAIGITQVKASTQQLNAAAQKLKAVAG